MSNVKVSLVADSAHLEIPIADMEQIARELGCQLSPSRRELTLEADGCSLTFDRVGPLGLLRELRIEGDENGLFAVHVLGRLLSAYEGELDAAVVTSPPGVYPSQLSVRGGESSHPLFATVMMPLSPVLTAADVMRIEQLLDEAETAWQAWQRSKEPPPSSPRSSRS